MGMDVHGKAPVNEKGKYFRRGIYGWPPLAECVLTACPAECAPCTHWRSNDGDGLDGPQSIALADRLDALIADGIIAAYVKERDEYIAGLPDQPCRFCNGSGVRTDMGKDVPYTFPPSQTVEERLARWHKHWGSTCNGCGGRGNTPPPIKDYELEVSDVVQFAAFVRVSGGFEIW